MSFIHDQVAELQDKAARDPEYTKVCFICKAFVVFLESPAAVAPGHIYSNAGVSEYDITRMCEWCFDEATNYDDEEDEMTNDNPMPGQITAIVPDLDSGDSSQMENDAQRYTIEMDYDKADVITSAVASKFGKAVHRPVIDIDFPVTALPSSNPQHSHLYIDKELTWKQYEKLLAVMVEVGLVEPGYLGASRERGFTAVRKPGKFKPGTPEDFTKMLDTPAPANFQPRPWDAPGPCRNSY